MKLQPKPIVAASILGAVLAVAGCRPPRVHYEGELSFSITNGYRGPMPLLHVVTRDEKVERIIARDRTKIPSRVESYFYSGRTVRRFQVLDPFSGRVIEDHDLSSGSRSGLSQAERETVQGRGEVLVRHFHAIGGYRKVTPADEAAFISPPVP